MLKTKSSSGKTRMQYQAVGQPKLELCPTTSRKNAFYQLLRTIPSDLHLKCSLSLLEKTCAVHSSSVLECWRYLKWAIFCQAYWMHYLIALYIANTHFYCNLLPKMSVTQSEHIRSINKTTSSPSHLHRNWSEYFWMSIDISIKSDGKCTANLLKSMAKIAIVQTVALSKVKMKKKNMEKERTCKKSTRSRYTIKRTKDRKTIKPNIV